MLGLVGDGEIAWYIWSGAISSIAYKRSRCARVSSTYCQSLRCLSTVVRTNCGTLKLYDVLSTMKPVGKRVNCLLVLNIWLT
jgi:hypothetical protein